MPKLSLRHSPQKQEYTYHINNMIVLRSLLRQSQETTLRLFCSHKTHPSESHRGHTLKERVVHLRKTSKEMHTFKQKKS